MLLNAKFDQGSYFYAERQELKISDQWTPAFRLPQPNQNSPEFKALRASEPKEFNPPGFLTNDYDCQKVFYTSSPGRCAIVQPITLDEQTSYTLTVSATLLVYKQKWWYTDLFDSEYQDSWDDVRNGNRIWVALVPAHVIGTHDRGYYTPDKQYRHYAPKGAFYLGNDPNRAELLGIDEIGNFEFTLTAPHDKCLVFVGADFQYGEQNNLFIYDVNLTPVEEPPVVVPPPVGDAMTLQSYDYQGIKRGWHHHKNSVSTESYLDINAGWVKFVSGGSEFVNQARELRSNGVDLMWRVFRPNMGFMTPGEGDLTGYWNDFQNYYNAGVRWFEFGNEWNLDGEWPQSEWGKLTWEPNSDGTPNAWVTGIMDRWINWAKEVINRKAYPAFPAFAPTGDNRHATVRWMYECIRYLYANHFNDAHYVFTHGAWIATHPYLLNHFAVAKDNRLIPNGYLNYDQDEWFFEYPFDPVQTSYDPNRTPFGSSQEPNGDVNGAYAEGEVVLRLLKAFFNVGPLPVIGTEAGWAIPPKPGDEPQLYDTRYYPTDPLDLADIILAWEYDINAPDWFFGFCLWTSDFYFSDDFVTGRRKLVSIGNYPHTPEPLPTDSGTYTPLANVQYGLPEWVFVPTTQPPPVDECSCECALGRVIATPSLRVRNEPSLDAMIITQLPTNTIVCLSDTQTIGDQVWVAIQDATQSITGWCAKSIGSNTYLDTFSCPCKRI